VLCPFPVQITSLAQATNQRLCELTMPERPSLRKEPVISIVDDDQFVRDSLKRLMKSFGYIVAAYPSAGDFLKSPQVQETSCLIVDVNLPGMTRR
jgi:PleD family two-component response regulator